ncbi:MAG TPA: Mov34/MPN/PAD-1 family protein [Gaiellaceae bacterium]|nr:Mov34/MPN/PAD-1 family protein [Gaiellaceae bacterium]
MMRIVRHAGEGTATVTRRNRDATVASVTRSAPLFLPSLPASYQATIYPEAERQIRRETRRMYLACNGDMHETGGWLMAHPHSPDRIVHATYPGDDAPHSRSSMRLGLERLEAVTAQLPHLRVAGTWHVHPGTDEDGVPSSADRRAWAKWRELDGGFHIGLIVTQGRSAGWTDPELHGWLVTEEFCERLALKQEGH